MRIGMSLSSSYGVDDAREAPATWSSAPAPRGEAGLDSLFVGDHHNSGPRKYYQNIPILGRMLAEWGDRPAGALFLLPLWHPVHLAEQIAPLPRFTVDDSSCSAPSAERTLSSPASASMRGIAPRGSSSRWTSCSGSGPARR